MKVETFLDINNNIKENNNNLSKIDDLLEPYENYSSIKSKIFGDVKIILYVRTIFTDYNFSRIGIKLEFLDDYKEEELYNQLSKDKSFLSELKNQTIEYIEKLNYVLNTSIYKCSIHKKFNINDILDNFDIIY